VADNSNGSNHNAQRLAELAALVDAVKERVRTQYPESSDTGATGGICVGLPDLTALGRARDAAAGKMAAIGTVNPRPGGLVNNSIQTFKRAVSRALNWFVRDQVIFNRQMITCIENCIEALADVNRTIHALAGQANNQIQQVRAEAEPLRTEARTLRSKTSELQDLASHWHRWREEWQLKLHKNEVEFLKSVADLNAAVQQKMMYAETATQHRQTALDAGYRQALASLEANFERRAAQLEHNVAASLQKQHDDFEQLANSHAKAIEASATSQIEALAAESRNAISAMNLRLVEQAKEFEQALATSVTQMQEKFYGDLDRIRTEYERVIHAELRIVRQRMAAGSAVAAPATRPVEAPSALPFDYARFAERFRGPAEYVTESQRFYLPFFSGRRHVLDVGCGRGEFLKLMQQAGVPARGIEASDESVEYCRSLGLDATRADLFAYLTGQSEASLDGIFCSQVVEHLPTDRLPEMVRICASRLATGGVLAIETPNPECLAIFGSHFYLDPTHTRPVPSQLLAFYMEESGLGRVEVHPKAPAIETMPEVGELPEGFRNKFFGGLDYAIIAYKL
jgi:2-polyprenyl-3-methyl-5-hydroxy-6-metoxy-1,4-benzoquinol methylase